MRPCRGTPESRPTEIGTSPASRLLKSSAMIATLRERELVAATSFEAVTRSASKVIRQPLGRALASDRARYRRSRRFERLPPIRALPLADRRIGLPDRRRGGWIDAVLGRLGRNGRIGVRRRRRSGSFLQLLEHADEQRAEIRRGLIGQRPQPLCLRLEVLALLLPGSEKLSRLG